jgi:hypothetical protein
MESLQQLIPLLASAGGVWLQFSLRFGSGVLFILPDDLSDEKKVSLTLPYSTHDRALLYSLWR